MFKKKISKKIVFLKIDKINPKTIQKAINFVQNQPVYKDSKYTGGKEILFDCIKVDLNVNGSPMSISFGINSGVVCYTEIKVGLYYFYKGNKIESTENPDDIKFW